MEPACLAALIPFFYLFELPGDSGFPGGMPPMHGQGANDSGQGPLKKSQGAGGKANSRGVKVKQSGG